VHATIREPLLALSARDARTGNARKFRFSLRRDMSVTQYGLHSCAVHVTVVTTNA
jgi:hypothetical protein